MSQLEKFKSRQAKMKTDTVVIKEQGLKNSTPEKQGEKIAKQHGLTTEDIFAVITRESMGPFIKMWNNSMENVIRETIRTEIRQIMQEEMVAAYKGIMKGLMPEIDIDIKEQVAEVIKEEIEPLIPFEEPQLKETPNKLHIDKNVSLDQAIILLNEAGINPTVGATWTKQGGRFSTLYVNFMKDNKGIKGAWRNHVLSVLKNADNEQL